jgi:hypothetical protein
MGVATDWPEMSSPIRWRMRCATAVRSTGGGKVWASRPATACARQASAGRRAPFLIDYEPLFMGGTPRGTWANGFIRLRLSRLSRCLSALTTHGA